MKQAATVTTVTALMLSAVTLSACSLAPSYHTPNSSAAASAYQEDGDWARAQPADGAARGSWWSIFNDPQLDALQTRVSDANQDLKSAFARLQQTRAETRIARAGYVPNLSLGAGATRARSSTTTSKYAGQAPIANDYQLEADLSYELDVWGRVRNGVASARASEQASAADLATVTLATHAELASDYFLLRSADARQQLLEQTVADYDKALQLTQRRYDGGAAALSDVAQAQAQLETARTQAADTQLQRAQLQHAIAVLVGESASSFKIDPQPLPQDLTPPAVDVGLPSQLLERRPDIAAAERRVAAANAQIGVARAAYFPVFSISALAGFESATISHLLEAPSRLWSLGSSAAVSVFDGGRRGALSDQALAVYDQTAADYRGTVLNAYREVEDNLVALHQLEQESRSQAAAVAATQTALRQANYRYHGGVSTYLEVVSTENAALQAQLSALDIQTRRLNASVLLVKTLGGGWQNGDAAVPVAANTPLSNQQTASGGESIKTK